MSKFVSSTHIERSIEETEQDEYTKLERRKQKRKRLRRKQSVPNVNHTIRNVKVEPK